MNIHSFSRKLIAGLMTGALALSLAVFNVSPAFAQDSGPTTPPELTRPEIRQQRVERLYQRTLNWRDAQTDNLARANEAAAKTQAYIDEKKAAGLDTSSLEAALAAYQTQIAEAQSFHDKAVGILSTHSGFDDAGMVTDITAARVTIADSAGSLGQARVRLVNAGYTLRQAVKAFREANGLTTTTP
jgi:hypothetical protein